MPNNLYDFRVIRILRRQWGLTLEQLARKASLTYATVVAVETNKTYPSLKTLDALALALHVSTSQLVHMAEQRQVQKRKMKPMPLIPESHTQGSPQCRVAQFDAAKIFHVTAKAGEVVEAMIHHGDVHELCYVLKGVVELHIEDSVHRLESQEVTLFNGTLQHAYHQIETGEYITVHIPKDIRVIERLLAESPS